MRYLFFDIESADGYGKVCEFGYVITDTSFNVLKKHNILINPNGKFKFRHSFIGKGFKLTYEYDEYYKHKTFDNYYSNIKYLLTQKDILIFGFSSLSDILFLSTDCLKYGLPLIDFEVFDIQKLVLKYYKDLASLSKGAAFLVNENKLTNLKEHNALDDAYKTMLLLKNLISLNSLNIEDIIKENVGFKLDALKEFKVAKEHEKRKLMLKKAQNELENSYLVDANEIDLKKKEGKLITLYGTIKTNSELINLSIKLVNEKGYYLVKNLINANYLLVSDNDNKEEVRNNINSEYVLTIINLNELKDR